MKKIILLKNGIPSLVEVPRDKDLVAMKTLLNTEHLDFLTLEERDGKGYFAVFDVFAEVKGLEDECYINFPNGVADFSGPVLIVKFDRKAQKNVLKPDNSFLDDDEMFKVLEHLEWEPHPYG